MVQTNKEYANIFTQVLAISENQILATEKNINVAPSITLEVFDSHYRYSLVFFNGFINS